MSSPSNPSCAESWPASCARKPPMRCRSCGPSWPRCAPTWRSCSTPSSASVRRWRVNASPYGATANGTARTRAPASGSTGSRRCGPKSRPGAPTTRSSTCTRSRWSLLRQGSRPRRAISRRTPSSSPPRRMQRRGKTGRRRRSRHRNQNAAPIGVRATTPDNRAHGPRRQRHPHPHLRPSVRRKAKAGLHRNGNRSPAVGPRRGHRPPPGPSDSSHHSARDVHIGGLRRLRSLSRSSPRRQNRSRSRLQPEPNSCRRLRRPSRHSNSREFHGRRPRKSPASKSSRPGSRSAPRDSGCRAGAPGSHWNASQADSAAPSSWAYDNAPSRDRTSHRSPSIGEPPSSPVERRGRHSSGPAEPSTGQAGEAAAEWGESGRRARSRHSADFPDPGFSGSATPAPAMSPPPPPPPPSAPSSLDKGPVMSPPPPPPPPSARHRSTDPYSETEEPPSGGQSVAELLARLQTAPSEGGRRRRRED